MVGVVHGRNRPWELSMGGVVHGATWLRGEMSQRQVVYGASCLWDELRWNDLSGNISLYRQTTNTVNC
jgi:hypothetical protein